MLDQIREIALEKFTSMVECSGYKQKLDFEIVTYIKVGKKSKPLYILGNILAGGSFGQCIAILNPTRALLQGLTPTIYGVLFPEGFLVGRCDAALNMLVTQIGEVKVKCEVKYLSEQVRPVESNLDNWVGNLG